MTTGVRFVLDKLKITKWKPGKLNRLLVFPFDLKLKNRDFQNISY